MHELVHSKLIVNNTVAQKHLIDLFYTVRFI